MVILYHLVSFVVPTNQKVDLFYFNNVNTFVVFYLINEEADEVYMNDSWISAIGLNYKKYVRKINEILNR